MQNLQEKTFDLLENTGLNWTVNKEPLQTADGKTTNSFGMFRNDNGQHLGTVGTKYVPFQNHELAETIIAASDSINIQANRGGVLGAGAKVFFQAELPQEHIGNSGIKRFITAVNSHDGWSSVGFGSSNTVIVCQNTFYRAYKEVSKFRHTESVSERIAGAVRDMRITMGLDQKLMENFKRMADLQLKDEVVEKVIRKLFDVAPNTAQAEVSARKKNQIEAFAGALTTEIGLEGKTVWGLFNGVTRYTNHVAAPKDSKEAYVMDGGGYRLSNLAFEEIMSWVDKNTAELVPVSI